MSELIRREDALAYPLKWNISYNPDEDNRFICGVESYRDWIEELPSIDAVEVVRCKECKHYEADWCYWRDVEIRADDYCSYGEREGE